MIRISETVIPVLIGHDYRHVMCKARIVEENDVVTVTMTAKGEDARDLIAFISAMEPMALSFVAIPVTPHKPRIKEND